MPPSISRTPDFSNQFLFPSEVREIGILLLVVPLLKPAENAPEKTKTKMSNEFWQLGRANNC